uniref:Uncharacterized protein n=1 Tax=Arundo donax TaxID=35708 RepID=A0A0A8YTX9_ARUDO
MIFRLFLSSLPPHALSRANRHTYSLRYLG